MWDSYHVFDHVGFWMVVIEEAFSGRMVNSWTAKTHMFFAMKKYANSNIYLYMYGFIVPPI